MRKGKATTKVEMLAEVIRMSGDTASCQHGFLPILVLSDLPVGPGRLMNPSPSGPGFITSPEPLVPRCWPAQRSRSSSGQTQAIEAPNSIPKVPPPIPATPKARHALPLYLGGVVQRSPGNKFAAPHALWPWRDALAHTHAGSLALAAPPLRTAAGASPLLIEISCATKPTRVS